MKKVLLFFILHVRSLFTLPLLSVSSKPTSNVKTSVHFSTVSLFRITYPFLRHSYRPLSCKESLVILVSGFLRPKMRFTLSLCNSIKGSLLFTDLNSTFSEHHRQHSYPSSTRSGLCLWPILR